MNKIKVLGIIPARGGSKGVPGKNIRLLNGKPLISYTINAAKKSKYLKDVIVSTDSSKISAVVKKFKAKVPFLRPENLAKDKTPTLPVLKHALCEYEKLSKQQFTHIMLLQATTPLRTAKDIDRAIGLIHKTPRRNSLISCYEGTGVHPQIMYKKKGKKAVSFLASAKEMARRQTFESVYVRNGAIYIIKKSLLLNENKMIGTNPIIMEMPRWQSINIDAMEDLKMAGMILKYYEKS